MEELFEYKIEDEEVCITKYLGSSKEVVIPKEIEGYPVTSIGEYAFHDNQLESVDLTGVESIGEYAFFNNKLTSIDLTGVESIGYCVFYNNNLEAIILPGLESKVKEFRARTKEIFNFDEEELDNRNKKYVKKYVDKMRELYMKKLYKNSRKHGLIIEYITYYTYHESYKGMLKDAVALEKSSKIVV